MITDVPPVTATPHPARVRLTPSDTAARLGLEWSRLRCRPDAVRRARTWRVADREIHDLDDVLAAIGFAASTTPATEAALRRLVATAADDELAARVVIQRILPGLLALARRRSGGGRRGPVLDEALGAAWIAIRTFEPARRPACLAAALIADADHRAFRASRRRASAGELPVAEPGETGRAHTATLEAEDDRATILTLAAAARLDDDDRRMLARLVDAATLDEAARALAVSPRTLRNRRDRLARRLRAVALAS